MSDESPTSKEEVEQPPQLALLKRLEKYVRDNARPRFHRKRLFTVALRASFSKCYEFNLHAWDQTNAPTAFFCLPTLRGICEELIILGYMQRIPEPDRGTLITSLQQYESFQRLDRQKAFFSTLRRYQPVLDPPHSKAQLTALKDSLQNLWRKHGWPHLNKGVIPPTIEIAQKQGGQVLSTLYEFLYRLTSGTVHFNVPELFRTVWRGRKSRAVISTQALTTYYKMYGRIYGAFLFCMYFELFPRHFRLDKPTNEIVGELRTSILAVQRWPEIVTFEEMNVPIPKVDARHFIFPAAEAVLTERLLDPIDLSRPSQSRRKGSRR